MYFDLRTLKLAAALAVVPVAVAIYAASGETHRTWPAYEVPLAFWAWKTATPTSDETNNAATIFLRAGQMDLDNGEVKRIRPAKGSLPASVEVHLVYNGTRDLLLRGLELIGSSEIKRPSFGVYILGAVVEASEALERLLSAI